MERNSQNGQKMPVIASAWHRMIDYPQNHLNDFCVFRDMDDTWHATGILGTGTWDSETSLFHCSSPSLHERFVAQPPLLVDAPDEGLALQKHAPFVVVHGGIYHMFYRRPPGTIMHLKTANPFIWNGLGEEVFAENDARDICIVKVGSTFLMYYCQWVTYDDIKRSAILVRTSDDLESWSDAHICHVDLGHEDHHAKQESPFVLDRPEGYYLFLRNRHMDERSTTVILFSTDPMNFPSGAQSWFAEIDHVHAPEIVRDDGKTYLIRVSRTKHAGDPHHKLGGWLECAELQFR